MAGSINDQTRKHIHKSVYVEIIDGQVYATVTNGYFLLRKAIYDDGLEKFILDNEQENQPYKKSVLLKFDKPFQCRNNEKNYPVDFRNENGLFLSARGSFEINPVTFPRYKIIIPNNDENTVNNNVCFNGDNLLSLLKLLKKVVSNYQNITLVMASNQARPVGVKFSDDKYEYGLIIPVTKKGKK